MKKTENLQSILLERIGSMEKSLVGEMTALKEEVTKITECINGNGKRGIKDRLTRIETWGSAIAFLIGSGLAVKYFMG